jgi:hypothetical protein
MLYRQSGGIDVWPSQIAGAALTAAIICFISAPASAQLKVNGTEIKEKVCAGDLGCFWLSPPNQPSSRLSPQTSPGSAVGGAAQQAVDSINSLQRLSQPRSDPAMLQQGQQQQDADKLANDMQKAGDSGDGLVNLSPEKDAEQTPQPQDVSTPLPGNSPDTPMADAVGSLGLQPVVPHPVPFDSNAPCGDAVPSEVDFYTGNITCPGQAGSNPDSYWDSQPVIAQGANEDAIEDAAQNDSSVNGSAEPDTDSSPVSASSDAESGDSSPAGDTDAHAVGSGGGESDDRARTFAHDEAPESCPDGPDREDCKKNIPVIGDAASDAADDVPSCLDSLNGGSSKCDAGTKTQADLMTRLPIIGPSVEAIQNAQKAIQNAEQTYQKLLNYLKQGKSALVQWWNGKGA